MNNTTETLEKLTSVTALQENNGQSLFPLLSIEVYESFTFSSNAIASPILCVVGIIGNTLGLGLLLNLKKENNVSIYTYLSALTLTDMLYLVVGLLRRNPFFLKFVNERIANNFDRHTMVVFIYLDQFLIHTSTAIIVVMSIERLIAVVRPFKVKDTYFSKYPYIIVVSCIILNMISAAPLAVYFEAAPFVNENNITEYAFQSRNAYASNIILIEQTIVDFLVPVVILIFTNTGIAIAYSLILKSRRTTINMEADNIGSQQKKVTLTVFCITTMFLLLSIPETIIKIVAFVHTEYSWEGKYQYVFWFFIEVTNIMTYINAGNDFFIYVLVSDRCRKMFKNMYCSCCAQQTTKVQSDCTFSNINSMSGETLSSELDF